MDNRAIGVFDSGLGGLTAVKELMRLLPDEAIVYFGDTGRLPYGTKSNETIIRYTMSDLRFLNTFDLKAIIIACGTASTIGLPAVRGRCAVPIGGVAAPAAGAAARTTKNKRIGIIGTPGTIKSGVYAELLHELDSEIVTVSHECALFVPIVEAGWENSEVAYLTAREYLEPITREGVDTLILGCTHYPLLARTIARVVGEDVALINPGAEAAREMRTYLESGDMLCGEKSDRQYRFFVSDSVESFEELGSRFLERPLAGQVEWVDIEAYASEKAI